MDKKLLSLSLVLSFFAGSLAVYAQPSEELPVITVQEMSEEEKRLFLPSEEETETQQLVVDQVQTIPVTEDTVLEQNMTNAPITVGGVVDVAPPAAAIKDEPVEGTIKGLNFGAGLTVTPIGFGYLNGHKREYFQVSPNINLSTKLATDSKKSLNMNLSYEFAWQEYLDKEDPAQRGFTNIVNLGFDGKINDQWSYNFGMYGEWFLLSGEDSGSDNYLVLLSSPTAKMKIDDKTSLSLTYYFDYYQILNADVSLIDSIGGGIDTDDFGGGLFSDSVFGANTDDLGGFGLSNPTADFAWIENKLGFTADWKPKDGTSLRLNYRYAFSVYSNNPNAEWKGHLLRPKVTQDMPWWDGGTFSYELRFRQRTYDHALEGSNFKANRRIRHMIGFSQKINDSLSASLLYRLETNSSNADNYVTSETKGNLFNMNLSYTF
ncbi:MAG TPA: hypothetical protein PKC21_10740 [Oligoflexia bacterium]|nr:hypothetical protein [Oligoflexia bacterium]HMR25813.1 hypothetical protein [Oligoflexia bacterium]